MALEVTGLDVSQGPRKMVAEITIPASVGISTGRTDPVAIPVSTIASGAPFENRARTGRQTKGETQRQKPSITQTAAIRCAPAPCSVIQAERKVK